MRSKLINFYYFILPKRDVISFLAGIIVSGYVVEISIMQNLNKWHLLSIIVGIVIGVLLFILVRIGENFEDNTKRFKKNRPDDSIYQINSAAWISINDTNFNTNKILKRLPKFWLPLTTLLIPSLLVVGVLFLKCANDEILNKSQIERSDFVNQLDSNIQIRISNLGLTNEQLKDSLNILIEKMDFQTKQIDSLISIQSLHIQIKNRK